MSRRSVAQRLVTIGAIALALAIDGAHAAVAVGRGIEWSVSVDIVGSDPLHGHFDLVATAFSSCAQTVSVATNGGTYGAFIAANEIIGTDPFHPKGPESQWGAIGATIVRPGYHGPGTYTSADKYLEWDYVPPRKTYDEFTGSGATLIVRANGAGELALKAATGAAGAVSGSVRWTCRVAP